MPIVVTCESCSSKLKAPDNAAGKKIRCPKCQGVIAVPDADPVEAFAPAPAAPMKKMPPPVPYAPPAAKNEAPFENLDEEGSGLAVAPTKKNMAPGGKDAPNKLVVALMGLLFPAFGIHKFMLGYKKEGLIMLLVTLCTCGLGGLVMGPIGFVEGILYLTKSDEDFYNVYVVNKKPWF